MKTILLHIWKNYKTTIASVIGLLTVYFLGRGWIMQDTAELITQLTALVGVSANIIMNKQ